MVRFKVVGRSEESNRRVMVEGLRLPERFTALIQDIDGDASGGIQLSYRDGRYIAKSVTISTPPGGEAAVTARLVKGFLLDELVREAVTGLVTRTEEAAGLPYYSTPMDASEGPTSENLQRVARVYRRAYLVGRPPTKAVSDAFGLNPNTAASWVSKARKAGYLGEAPEQGKAGA